MTDSTSWRRDIQDVVVRTEGCTRERCREGRPFRSAQHHGEHSRSGGLRDQAICGGPRDERGEGATDAAIISGMGMEAIRHSGLTTRMGDGAGRLTFFLAEARALQMSQVDESCGCAGLS
jgi:hypothetical protein